MTFAIFHDFPGLENGLPKFHDQGHPGSQPLVISAPGYRSLKHIMKWRRLLTLGGGRFSGGFGVNAAAGAVVFAVVQVTAGGGCDWVVEVTYRHQQHLTQSVSNNRQTTNKLCAWRDTICPAPLLPGGRPSTSRHRADCCTRRQ